MSNPEILGSEEENKGSKREPVCINGEGEYVDLINNVVKPTPEKGKDPLLFY